MAVMPEKIEPEDAHDLLRRTLWGGELVRSLTLLRSRHPEASYEITAVELALADASREIEEYLEAGGHPGRG